MRLLLCGQSSVADRFGTVEFELGRVGIRGHAWARLLAYVSSVPNDVDVCGLSDVPRIS